MKKSLAFVCLMLAAGFMTHQKVRADVGPSQPDCPAEWSNDPYSSANICKVIDKKVSIATNAKFDSSYIFILQTNESNYCVNTTYSIMPNSLTVWEEGEKVGYMVWAVKKDYFQKNGGIVGIFKTTVKKDATGEFCQTNSIMSPKNQAEFNANFYKVTIDWDDRNDLAWWREGSSVIDADSDLPTSIYPYLVAPANSPVSAKEFVYSPAELRCESYKDNCEMVLYKSKEIWTLDNGDKKEYLFTSSQMSPGDKGELLIDDNLQNKASAQIDTHFKNANENLDLNNTDKPKQNCPAVETPVEKGFWAKIACFFKGLVGKKC